MKNLIRELMPPLFMKMLSKARRQFVRTSPAPPSQFAYGVEQPPEFYDQTYTTKAHWKKHYTASHYYPLWTVIADRLRHLQAKTVIDIGCGPGQVACLLRDLHIPQYIGLDFSPARIAQARSICPGYEFVVADVFKDNILEVGDYDCVLIMEFLEHVEQDIAVLQQIRPSTTILATVPNFPAAGHVRHFDSIEAVKARYAPLFTTLDVVEVLADEQGKTYYILQGVR